MEAAVREAECLGSRYGVAHAALSPAALRSAEPSLKTAGAGAVHWLEPWSVTDPGGLVEAYADLFVRSGGAIRQADAVALRRSGSGWSLRTAEGSVEAEHAVVALGPWSPELLAAFGYRIAIIRKRGYHRHWRGVGALRPRSDGRGERL